MVDIGSGSFGKEQSTQSIYESFQIARRHHMRLKNRLLISNQLKPYEFQDKIRRTWLFDLTDIDLSTKRCTALRMRRFDLTDLPQHIFSDNLQLRLVDFSSNNLSSIDPSTFERMKDLQILILRNNLLTNVDPLLISYLPNLQRLDLANNPISKKLKEKLQAANRFLDTDLKIIF